MKNLIILPLTENFTEDYAGAASLFVKETTNFKDNNSIIVGSTNFKKFINKNNYFNFKNLNSLPLGRNINYAKKIVKKFSKIKIDIVEIHNRPQIFNELHNKIKSKYILYFHNDPRLLRGSESINDRINLLKKVDKIIFVSEWIKKQYFDGISYNNSDKTEIIYPAPIILKNNFINQKENIITFAGKLNFSKGYDLFVKVAKEYLNKNKNSNWFFYSVGDEPRAKIDFVHKNFVKIGWATHNDTLKIFKKSSIIVVPSAWEEPLGRVAIEGSKSGAVVIISNKGGLFETTPYPIILNSLDYIKLYNLIDYLIKNKSILRKFQNFNLNHNYIRTDNNYIRKKIDLIKKDLLGKKINLILNRPIKILHVADMHIRHNGRLYYSTVKKLNNGFIKKNYNLQQISDRDIVRYNKSITDPRGNLALNNSLKEYISNFKPDILLLGHADSLSNNTLFDIKNFYKNIKIAQWFLDPLIVTGPDFQKNKSRVNDKLMLCNKTFITTFPNNLKFKIDKKNLLYLPNPVDESIDYLENYLHDDLPYDVFAAISHGQHRGILKLGKTDSRNIILNKIENSPYLKTLFFGKDYRNQPVWGDNFFYYLSKCSMAVNISRGIPQKFYSSDRVSSLMGNGLLTFIHKKYYFSSFFKNNYEIIEYSNVDELIYKLNYYKQNSSLRKLIAKRGREKYFKLFNSEIISEYIVKRTLDLKYSAPWE